MMTEPNLTSIVQTAVEEVEKTQADDLRRVVAAATGSSDADEILDDQICEMKGYFGALAANQVSDAESLAAISIVEGWITDNVSNRSLDRRAAGALTMISADDLVSALAA